MRVFVSSVYGGLEDLRDRLIEAINASGEQPVAMEGFGARPEQPLSVCLSEVRTADVAIVIVGPRYGSKDAGTGLSFTHLEFREAVSNSIPVLALELATEEPSAESRAGDAEGLEQFRQEVRENLTVQNVPDPNRLPELAMAALHRFAARWASRPGQFRALQEANDFFSSQLEPQALFNHAHAIVGREPILRQLDEFLDGDRFAGVLPGAGGVGKSKLLLELSRRRSEKKPSLVFLASQVEATPEKLKGLPPGPVCVVVDDAHRLTSLEELVRALAGSPDEGRVKLLLTSRPSGMGRIRHALRGIREQSVRIFDELRELDPGSDALTLARQSLGTGHDDLAVRLVAAADGNPLVITVGGKLISAGELEPSLLAHKERFKAAALDGLTTDLPDRVVDEVPSRPLLAVLAAIGPVRPGREPAVALIGEHLHVAASSVSKAIVELEERHRLLLRRGFKVRIQPDVLSDHILFTSAVADEQPTGFIKEAYDAFGSVYLSNLLVNAAELEWRCRTLGRPVDVLTDVWRALQMALPTMPHRVRRDLLANLERAAWFAPQQVWDILQWTLEHADAPEDPSPVVQAIGVGQDRVVAQAPDLLRILACHERFTGRATALLWRLGAGDERALHSHPDAPLRVLQDLLSYDPQRPVRFQANVLTELEAALGEDESRGVRRDVSEVIAPVLSRDPTYHRGDAKGFRMGTLVIPGGHPEVRSLRARACDVLERQARGPNPELAVRAIHALDNLLVPPHGLFGRQVSDDEVNSWLPEVQDCLDRLMSVAEATQLPLIAFEIGRRLRGAQRIRTWQAALDRIERAIRALPRHDNFPLYQAMLPVDVATEGRDDDEAAQEEHVAQARRAAQNLWRECGSAEAVANRAGATAEEFSAAGLRWDSRILIEELCEVRPAAIPQLAAAVVNGQSDLLKRECAGVFRHWLRQDAPAALAAVRAAIERGEEALLIGIAVGYANKWFGAPEVHWQQHLENIRLLVSSPFDSVRRMAAHSLWWGKGICEREALDVLVSADFSSDAKLLDQALGAIDRSHGLDPDLLTESDAESILAQVAAVPELGHGAYHIDGFLSMASGKWPRAVVRMLLRRVRRAASLPDNQSRDYQPLPYVEFHRGLGGLAQAADYRNLLREIRDEVLKEHWVYKFWIPRLYSLTSDNFCPAALEVLREWSTKTDEARVVAAAHLTREAEHEFVFTNHEFLAELLANAESLGGDCLRRSSSEFFCVGVSGLVTYASGQPPPRYVSDKRRAEQMAEHYRGSAAVARFYHSLAEHFGRRIEEHLAEDEEFLDQ